MPGAVLTHHISDALLPHPPDKLGIAVSGGADSIALLHLSARFCARNPTKLHAVTVNHNLRPEAAGEAAEVARHCAELGVPHETLSWDDAPRSGNLQDNARNARYDLMAEWAVSNGISTMALGHTADDQAETVLLRMARRAGVDGLAAMQMRRLDRGVTWLRPLLDVRREALRGFLRAEGLGWCEDPSNDNIGYDRIKARKALDVLAGLGIDAPALAEIAQNMADARKALNWHAFTAAQEIVQLDGGAVIICDRRLRILPDEIQRRILLRAISWVNGAIYPPRRAAVHQMMMALRQKQAATLDGCHARYVKGQIWVFREYEAVRDLTVEPCDIWDRRWRLEPALPSVVQAGATLRALGEEGIAQCGSWRHTGRPLPMLLSTPSLWVGDEVIAAPLAGMSKNWTAHLDEGDESFYSALLSH